MYAELEKLPLVALATDGWKKKFAEHGVPLVNAMALKGAGGGSAFLKVVTAAGVTKDAQWIADLHVQLAEDLLPGKATNLLGVIMDNTKANRNALGILKAKFPKWLTLGCAAHALALVIKDLDGDKTIKCIGTHKVRRCALDTQLSQLAFELSATCYTDSPCPEMMQMH